MAETLAPHTHLTLVTVCLAVVMKWLTPSILRSYLADSLAKP